MYGLNTGRKSRESQPRKVVPVNPLEHAGLGEKQAAAVADVLKAHVPDMSLEGSLDYGVLVATGQPDNEAIVFAQVPEIGWFYHLMNGLIIVFAATFFFGIPILSLIVIEGSFKNPPPLGKAYGFGAGLTLLLAFYLQRVYKAHASPVYVLTNVRWIKVDGGKATSVLFENVVGHEATIEDDGSGHSYFNELVKADEAVDRERYSTRAHEACYLPDMHTYAAHFRDLTVRRKAELRAWRAGRLVVPDTLANAHKKGGTKTSVGARAAKAKRK